MTVETSIKFSFHVRVMYEPTEAYADTVVKQVRSHGLPEQPAQWLIKALHPPSDGPLVTMPDNSSLNTVRITYRPTETIGPPTDLIEPDGTWDCCIVVLPGDCTGAVWATGPAGTDFTSQDFAALHVGVISLVDDYDLQSCHTNSTDPTLPSRSISAMPKGQYGAFRTVSSSITVTNVASSLYNGGLVYAGQYSSPWEDVPGATVGPAMITDTYPVACEQWAFVPLSEAALTQLTPRFYSDEAKHGVYMPIRLNNDNTPFVRRKAWKNRLVSGHGGDIVESIEKGIGASDGFSSQTVGTWAKVLTGQQTTSDGYPMVPPGYSNWIQRAMRGAPPYFSMDTGYDTVATGVIIFRGLDTHARLQTKVLRSLELVPFQLSPLMPLIAPPTEPCPQAIQLYYSVVSQMPMAYPARMNLLGGLLPILGRALATAMRYILPVAKSAGKAALAAAVPVAGSAIMKAVAPRTAPPQKGSTAARDSWRQTFPDQKKVRR